MELGRDCRCSNSLTCEVTNHQAFCNKAAMGDGGQQGSKKGMVSVQQNSLWKDDDELTNFLFVVGCA